MTVLLPLVHITVRKESFHFPVFFYSSISTPQGISIKLLMYFNNLTLNTHSYKDIAHVHVNIEPKGVGPQTGSSRMLSVLSLPFFICKYILRAYHKASLVLNPKIEGYRKLPSDVYNSKSKCNLSQGNVNFSRDQRLNLKN